MDQKQAQKIEYWEKVLQRLQEVDLPTVNARVGDAGMDGGWHENFDYENAIREKDVIEARIKEVKKIIQKLNH